MIVRLPASLSKNGKPGMIDVEVTAGATLRAVLDEVEKRIPGATAKLLDADGKPHRFVNMYVNGDDIRFSAGVDTPVAERDEVLILPAISGG
ncbi:MAG TPA: MoaD/ThiS family protein [Micromonosporaceae bacterium]|jgi:molybdopterin converting factor small subunit